MLYVNDDITVFDLEAALAGLPECRREKALRFRTDLLRRQSVAAWILLRDALRRDFGIEEMPQMDFTPAGKPFFPSRPDIQFNMSHCREAVACAVDVEPVGVDVEAVVKKIDDALLREVLNDEEIAQVLAAESREEEFTRIWTMKESAVKLTGDGLTDTSLLRTIRDDGRYVFETSIVAGRYVVTECHFRK